MDNNNRAYGAFAATITKKLKKSGLAGKSLELALAAVKRTSEAAAVKVPRKVVKTLGQMLAREQRAVVVVGRSGKMKVFSLDGFASTQKHSSELAKKHKPWMAAAKKRKEAALGAPSTK